jgi:hypothetical protein
MNYRFAPEIDLDNEVCELKHGLGLYTMHWHRAQSYHKAVSNHYALRRLPTLPHPLSLLKSYCDSRLTTMIEAQLDLSQKDVTLDVDLGMQIVGEKRRFLLLEDLPRQLCL